MAEPTVVDVSADVSADAVTDVVVAELVTDAVATMVVEPPTTEVIEPIEPAATQAFADDDNEEAPAATQEFRRVGQGVPVPTPEAGPRASEIDPATAAAWHGIPPKKPRRALLRGWLLPLLVLVGVIILLLWQRIGGPLSVTGASASAGTPSIGCDSTEIVTATLHTNGDAGTIVYRWVRSDGTVSDELRQTVSKGTNQIHVVLRWAFTGHGSMHALATIDVESPGAASAVASFDYVCP